MCSSKEKEKWLDGCSLAGLAVDSRLKTLSQNYPGNPRPSPPGLPRSSRDGGILLHKLVGLFASTPPLPSLCHLSGSALQAPLLPSLSSAHHTALYTVIIHSKLFHHFLNTIPSHPVSHHEPFKPPDLPTSPPVSPLKPHLPFQRPCWPPSARHVKSTSKGWRRGNTDHIRTEDSETWRIFSLWSLM